MTPMTIVIFVCFLVGLSCDDFIELPLEPPFCSLREAPQDVQYRGEPSMGSWQTLQYLSATSIPLLLQQCSAIAAELRSGFIGRAALRTEDLLFGCGFLERVLLP